MGKDSFEVSFDLEGWSLYWALLEAAPERDIEGAALRMNEVRRRVSARVHEDYELPSLAADPTVAALRRLFRAAGCDPTRYRPSSEALLRRLLKGAELPAIHPLVDLNNCLSAVLAVPCCVMDEPAVKAPFRLRAGAAGEAYESLKGPFNLAGKPLLADAQGPCDAPITGSRRVKVGPATARAWLVAYLPAGAAGVTGVTGAIAPETVHTELAGFLDAAPVAKILTTASF